MSINVNIHAHSGQELKATLHDVTGSCWVSLKSGDGEVTIFTNNREHAERIVAACNWKSEPPQVSTPEAVIDSEFAEVGE